jgi:hypothetical protein
MRFSLRKLILLLTFLSLVGGFYTAGGQFWLMTHGYDPEIKPGYKFLLHTYLGFRGKYIYEIAIFGPNISLQMLGYKFEYNSEREGGRNQSGTDPSP